jgi:hypothetical protein
MGCCDRPRKLGVPVAEGKGDALPLSQTGSNHGGLHTERSIVSGCNLTLPLQDWPPSSVDRSFGEEQALHNMLLHAIGKISYHEENCHIPVLLTAVERLPGMDRAQMRVANAHGSGSG